MQENATLTIEDAQIIFRNFEGRETEMNAAGKRNFSVVLRPDLAEMMRRDGWNVKQRKSRDDDSEPEFHLSVAVGFKIRPPRIVMINSISKRRTVLEEDTCEILDWADILTTDLIIRARPWAVLGGTGIKAYLKTMFAIINEDQLELKYAEDGQWGLPAASGGLILEGEIVDQYALEGPRG